MQKTVLIRVLTTALVGLFLQLNGYAEAASQWLPRDDGVTVSGEGDNLVYQLSRGYLDYTGDDVDNVVLDFEMQTPGDRSFFYLYFRQQDNREGEVVYIRNHKPNAPDTLQYSPVFQGRSAWQLYHGEKGTAAAAFFPNVWTKVRIEIRGQRLTIWVQDTDEPVMNQVALKHPVRGGGVSFRGNIPRGSVAQYTAKIRNIQVHSLPADALHDSKLNEDVTPKSHNASHVKVTQFNVSQAFAAKKAPDFNLSNVAEPLTFSVVKTDSRGMLELLQHRAIPNEARVWGAVLATTLIAPDAMQCQVNIGFSDTIKVFLNDVPLTFADASYRYRNNRQEGIFHDSQLSLFLNLRKGTNSLSSIVSDSFGGWGYQLTLVDCVGVEYQ